VTLKDKAKTYNFWISLVSAVVLIVRIVGNKFNIFIDTTLIMDITTGLCSIFVILGILSAPKSNNNENSKVAKQENKEETVKEEINSEETTLNESLLTESEVLVEAEKVNECEPNNETMVTAVENISAVEQSIFDKTTVLNIIEELKAEIHKANKIVEDYSNKL